jgi:hypothetical protein
MLRRVRHWSPYIGLPWLRDIKSFDRTNWLRHSRPIREPYALLSEIRSFNRRRLSTRSQRIASKWPQEVLQSIRGFNRRRLRRPAQQRQFAPRSWQLWESRRSRRLPFDLKRSIENRNFRLRHIVPPVRQAPGKVLSGQRLLGRHGRGLPLAAQRITKLRRMPETLQSEIHNFNRSWLRPSSFLKRTRGHPYLNEVRSFNRTRLRPTHTRVSREHVSEQIRPTKRALPFLSDVRSFNKARLRRTQTRVSLQPVPMSTFVRRQAPRTSFRTSSFRARAQPTFQPARFRAVPISAPASAMPAFVPAQQAPVVLQQSIKVFTRPATQIAQPTIQPEWYKSGVPYLSRTPAVQTTPITSNYA